MSIKLKMASSQGDVQSNDGKQWFYTDKVKDHFFNPRNIFKTQQEAQEYACISDGIGLVGSPACGDGMKMFLRVNKDTNSIDECKWQTFGCGTAIASTSAFSVMITEGGGMKIEDALKVKPKDIANALGGIPPLKFHCSVLADKALKEALNDYFKKSGQKERMIVGKVKVVDKILKITDHDIEEAVLEGALTFEAVQKKTKVGVHDKECIPKVKELIKFYQNKYFGEE